ncbi:UNKNOWN [Stylonychia lemnae]|uniref:Uncharacterized protein n=1 Tax=Stylonychia lemnae TaxID=5949 RepID=A0A078B309_STYLE|nr:UNKNOWN [Stylonychia lemnae]|eukprot:CDW88854.1 UNKNOWN [Stylonychia lemnae]
MVSYATEIEEIESWGKTFLSLTSGLSQWPIIAWRYIYLQTGQRDDQATQPLVQLQTRRYARTFIYRQNTHPEAHACSDPVHAQRTRHVQRRHP